MDVVAAFPNATRQYWIDVTVRSPHAERYNQSDERNAQNVPGLAASKGCQEKWDKYESQEVIPIAYEPYGRIAIESLRRLEEISINAASMSQERWTPPTLLTQWLRDATRAVIWAAADIDLLSVGTGATKREEVIARTAQARAAASPNNEGERRVRQRTGAPHG